MGPLVWGICCLLAMFAIYHLFTTNDAHMRLHEVSTISKLVCKVDLGNMRQNIK